MVYYRHEPFLQEYLANIFTFLLQWINSIFQNFTRYLISSIKFFIYFEAWFRPRKELTAIWESLSTMIFTSPNLITVLIASLIPNVSATSTNRIGKLLDNSSCVLPTNIADYNKMFWLQYGCIHLLHPCGVESTYH